MPSGLLPHDMLHAMRILSTPPNPRKRSYDTMALSSSSSDTSTSDSIAGRKSSPIPLPHAQNHTAVRRSTGYKTVKRNNNTMDISRSFSVEATSPPLSGYQPILQPSRGILRTMPYEVSGDLRPTYYSEKSYPTPLAPPTPYAIKAQLGEIEACRAALQSTKSQSIAEKNDKRARKRAFRVRKEMTYRVPEPVFVEVIEIEVSTPEHAHSTPPRTTRPECLSPLDIVHPPLSPARAVASDETSETSSLSSEEEPETISRLMGKLRTEIPDMDDDLTDIEDAEISYGQDEDSLNNDLTEVESEEMADDEKDSEDEGTVNGEESSDDEVNPDGKVADEAETLISTEHNNIPSPDNADSCSDFTDFKEPGRSRRKRKTRSASTQDPETEPKLVMRGTPNLTLREHLKAQPKLNSKLGFPKNRTGTNYLSGFSARVLSIPRVVRKG